MLPAFLRRFHPRLLDLARGYSGARFVADLGAGITVAVVALPLAMAFAIASGVKPEQGIVTAIVAGALISALGGSSVQIGGPAGAFIVIVYGIVERYGLTNLLIATALAGVLLFALGALRLGGLVRYIPVTIVIGFTNGIAVLIGLSQLRDLLGLQIAKMPGDFFGQLHALGAHLASFNRDAFGLGALCLAALFAWQRVLKATRWPIPGPIVALVVLTAAAALLHLPVETIGTRFGGIPQALPSLALPPFSWASAQQLVMPTVTIALLGAIESLLCARVADQLTNLPRHDPNQELMAQGIANMVAPVFGGIPATGTIARTVTNARAGATSPVAGIVHALVLLAIVLVAAPLAAYVPLAVLAGILLHVAWNMGEWHEFARLRRFGLPYRATLLGTFALTVVFDLTVAVEVGLLLACGFFIWRMGSLFEVRGETSDREGVRVYRLFGALFFGAAEKIDAIGAGLPAGTRVVILEMHRLISLDNTGLEALRQLARTLAGRGVRLLLCDVNAQPRGLIERAGLAGGLGAGELLRDLPAALAASAVSARSRSAAP